MFLISEPLLVPARTNNLKTFLILISRFHVKVRYLEEMYVNVPGKVIYMLDIALLKELTSGCFPVHTADL